jgi:hypothetical protein
VRVRECVGVREIVYAFVLKSSSLNCIKDIHLNSAVECPHLP